ALEELARRMAGLLERRGHVWHHGSDEFVVVVPLLPGMPPPEQLAEELLQEAEAPLSVLPYTLFLSTKAGISLCPQHVTDADGLLRLAAIAARQASPVVESIQLFGVASPQNVHN